MIRLRFVAGVALSSDLIKIYESFPFSHVEAVTPEGKYLGALFDGGVQARSPDYDKGQFSAEKFLTLADASDGEAAGFYSFLNGKIGTPYDYEAILGFASRLDLHQTGAVICSALQALGLRSMACRYFKTPLAVHAHEISPRDLALMLSARIPF